MRFSERYGYKKVRHAIQIDSMDEALRNGLWNLIRIDIWDKLVEFSAAQAPSHLLLRRDTLLKQFCIDLWTNFYKKPIESLELEAYRAVEQLYRHFYDLCWHEVYDFVEHIANYSLCQSVCTAFISKCNIVLEKEMSAYRFISGQIAPITEPEQIDEIEAALKRTVGPVRTHLSRALELLSSREKPDYRNSIKESISSIESLVASITLCANNSETPYCL